MRFAILSDLHANRQAFTAVLTDIQQTGVDKLLCLGDIVGYGPSPAEVLEDAYSRVHHFVLGNHEAALVGSLDPACFNDDARRLLEWTRKRLGERALEFTSRFPLTMLGPDFRCAHGEFAAPADFRYIHTAADAAPSWAATPEPLLFVGHTHRPAVHLRRPDGTTADLPVADFALEPGCRYVVNVGAVGQPRDAGDKLASWVLYDAGRKQLCFRRVAFDWAGFRQELDRAKLPGNAAQRWEQIPDAMPVRQRVAFRPAAVAARPAPAAGRAGTAPQVAAPRRGWGWTAALAALLLLALGGAAWAWAKRGPATAGEALWRAPQADAGLPSVPAAADGNLLATPAAVGAVSAANPLPGWEIWLADAERTQIAATAETGETILRVTAAGRAAAWELRSLPVPAATGDRFAANATVRLAADAAPGRIRVSLLELRPADGSPRVLLAKELRKPALERWESLRFSLPKPAGGLPAAARVRLVVRGEGGGTVLLKNLRLQRKAD
ncbi:MAG: metallophosphoesterase family protein [Lentisphaeria bacterium]|jgi:predicted phosphodiesterase